MKLFTWTDGMYMDVELTMTFEQAESVSHQGQCDEDVQALMKVPAIRSQLDALNPDSVRKALREYGAWDADELADHETNLSRIVWLAGCDIRENN